MRKAISALLCILLLLSLTACMQGSTAANHDEDLISVEARIAAHDKDLDKAMIRLMRMYDVPGAVMAIINNGKVTFTKAYGLSDVENNISMDIDTVFQVASISKPVTAWGVMKLVEDKKIKLDDPVEKYLTRWHFPQSEFDSKEVTIRRLLAHTSGLSVSSYQGLLPEQNLPSLEESLAGYESPHVNPLTISSKPGLKWDYCGGGYTVLQLLIEEVSGETFENYMQKVVLNPIGMSSSTFEYDKVNKEKLAKAYDPNGKLMPNLLFPEKAAAGLYTSAPDLAKFVAAALKGPQNEVPGRGVLSPDTLELMFMVDGETDGMWGLGYQKYTSLVKSRDGLIMHSGSNFGWKAIFAENVKTNDGILVLTNSDNGGDLLFDLLVEWDEGDKK
ncbi:MAG: serine hydrolase domain-containing protein [Bacillota bacterium]